MKALVTGSAGFVGRHFVERLMNDGWDVWGVDPRNDTTHNSQLMVGDCRGYYQNNRHGVFDLIIHAAAVIPDRNERDRFPLAPAENISIDCETFQWATHTGQGTLVYFSSAAAYPMRLNCPPHKLAEGDIDLHDIESPDGMYGMAKLVGEYQAMHMTDVVIVRPFTGYGTDQSTDYPFPNFIDHAKKRLDPFPIWGDSLQVRDFVHIDDIVEQVMRMAAIGVCFRPLNIGTGRPTSMIELAELVTSMSGYHPEFKTRPEMPGGATYRCADIFESSHIYVPQVSLEEGIRRALETSS